MTIQADTTVGQVAVEHPLATRVFARYGIDFCCGGGRPLREVCADKGLDTDAVLEEVRLEAAGIAAPDESWDTAPLDQLADHIVATYHQPLRTELPRLEAMIRKVLEVHGSKDPGMFSDLYMTFRGLRAEMESHMPKEEEILFPMIRAGQGWQAEGPVSVMEQEHAQVGEALRRIRELTHDYMVPAEACNTWRALWHGLAALETDTHHHIHLENNILFPRALAG